MIPTLRDKDIREKRLLIRVDFNVPLKEGRISHDLRIRKCLPTLEYALSQKASIVLVSHLGRPQEGLWQAEFSLKPVAHYLSDLLGQQVRLASSLDDVGSVEGGQVVLLENIRFFDGEKANSPELGKRLASLCDVFVMDAFSVAHRAQASTVGVAEYAPEVCSGLFLDQELKALTTALQNPKHPLVAIVGGSKVSTKFQVLDSLLSQVDTLVVGGGMANTFLKAQNVEIGASLYEQDWIEEAQKLLSKAKPNQIILPLDVVVGDSLDEKAQGYVKSLTEIKPQDKIYDLGPKTLNFIKPLLKEAKTIIWNGPVGVFECPAFSHGTQQFAQAVAESDAFSLAGGGDTLAAIEQSQVHHGISYQSTAGGAFLEFLEGAALPGLEILKQRTLEMSVKSHS